MCDIYLCPGQVLCDKIKNHSCLPWQIKKIAFHTFTLIKKFIFVLLTATFGGFPLIFLCPSYYIVLQNIQTSKNMPYSKYPVTGCEGKKAVLQKPQMPQGFQDLAKIIPVGARFVGETLLCFNGSCHTWELHKPAKCLGRGRILHVQGTSFCKNQLGAWALLPHSCCQV